MFALPERSQVSAPPEHRKCPHFQSAPSSPCFQSAPKCSPLQSTPKCPPLQSAPKCPPLQRAPKSPCLQRPLLGSTHQNGSKCLRIPSPPRDCDLPNKCSGGRSEGVGCCTVWDVSVGWGGGGGNVRPVSPSLVSPFILCPCVVLPVSCSLLVQLVPALCLDYVPGVSS